LLTDQLYKYADGKGWKLIKPEWPAGFSGCKTITQVIVGFFDFCRFLKSDSE